MSLKASLGKILKGRFTGNTGTTLTIPLNGKLGRIDPLTAVVVAQVEQPTAATPIVSLTNANGTGDDTIDDVTATPTQTLINNNFRDVTDKIEEILTLVGRGSTPSLRTTTFTSSSIVLTFSQPLVATDIVRVAIID